VYPPIVARQRLGKHVTAATNTRNTIIIVRRVVFCAVHVVFKESRRLVLPRTSCLLNRVSRVMKGKSNADASVGKGCPTPAVCHHVRLISVDVVSSTSRSGIYYMRRNGAWLPVLHDNLYAGLLKLIPLVKRVKIYFNKIICFTKN
jgi:hypothetical protein